MAHRPQRLAEIIKQEISEMLKNELKDPRIGFLTVTGVDVSNGLRHARIYVSVLGKEEEKDESMEAIQRAKGFIRTELGQRIRLRHVPELAFVLDNSLEYSMKIANLIDKAKNQGKGVIKDD